MVFAEHRPVKQNFLNKSRAAEINVFKHNRSLELNQYNASLFLIFLGVQTESLAVITNDPRLRDAACQSNFKLTGGDAAWSYTRSTL